MKKIEIFTTNLINEIKTVFLSSPIAIITDTNYNLACNPFNSDHIDLIFKYKQREKNKPLSIFLYNPYDMKKYATNFNESILDTIITYFLPGPLNIILDKNTHEFDYAVNNNETIAFGSISNPIWRQFIGIIDQPIAMTSANISGTMDEALVKELTLLSHMKDNITHYVAGKDEIKSTKSSTIIKLKGNEISCLREGDILFKEIMASINNDY